MSTKASWKLLIELSRNKEDPKSAFPHNVRTPLNQIFYLIVQQIRKSQKTSRKSLFRK